jgi:hypothetical protein
MAARLRTFRALWTWRMTVVVGSLVFIALTIWLWPFIASGPWSVTVAVFALGLIASIVVGLIIADTLVRYMVVPLLTFSLGDQKFNSRTPKAKEKPADSLMTVGTAVHSATLIGILVFPLTASIQTMAGGTDPVSALVSWWRLDRWSWWHTGVFGLLWFVPLVWGGHVQRQALDIYDEISNPSSLPPAPAADLTAQGSNWGSRRRRRHRAK